MYLLQNVNYKTLIFVSAKTKRSLVLPPYRKDEKQQDVLLLSGPRERGHHDKVQN